MSMDEELKYPDGKVENSSGPEIIDVEANERFDGRIYSSKEQDWVDQHAHGFLGRFANFLVSWGVESRGEHRTVSLKHYDSL